MLEVLSGIIISRRRDFQINRINELWWFWQKGLASRFGLSREGQRFIFRLIDIRHLLEFELIALKSLQGADEYLLELLFFGSELLMVLALVVLVAAWARSGLICILSFLFLVWFRFSGWCLNYHLFLGQFDFFSGFLFLTYFFDKSEARLLVIIGEVD